MSLSLIVDATNQREENEKMMTPYGTRLREEMQRALVPLIGIYDVFSAEIAARFYNGLFISGFGFAASYYGLPDIGFNTWSDIAAFTQRLRLMLPEPHLLVDIDDGFGDPETACHVTALLASIGASGIVLEDQARPRRCGHVDGKLLMAQEAYLEKLERVLAVRADMVVVARTDASDPDDIRARVKAYAQAGADAVLVDGLGDLELIGQLKREVGSPLVFNQIAGGKSKPATLTQLRQLGASLVIYSTPCLFAAQHAVTEAMRHLREHDGRLPMPDEGQDIVTLPACQELLYERLEQREHTRRHQLVH